MAHWLARRYGGGYQVNAAAVAMVGRRIELRKLKLRKRLQKKKQSY